MWMEDQYRDWELPNLRKSGMGSLTEHKINPLPPERRMANKLRHFYQILHETEEKKRQQIHQKSAESWKHWFIEKGIIQVMYKQGIFSRSTKDDYSWITDLLHSDHFRDHVSGVRHYNFSQPIDTVGCYFGILYFTKKKEHNNGMDAADVQLIQQYRRHFGKDNVIVVMDDVEDSSDQEKIRILGRHPDIEDLYHNLFLFSQQEKSSEYRTLLSSLLNIKEHPQPHANEARTLNEVQRPNQQTSLSLMNKTAKYEPQMPACQNFGSEIPEFRYSMNYKKLGMCIIINNKKFDDSKMFPVRDGTDKDAEDLSKCFGDLGFEATVYNNLSCEVMKRLLECVAKSDHSDSACFACILLSHGKEGAICGTDGAIPINTLTKHFRGDQCKSLLGKPKLFFIQACRGPNKDEGVAADSEPADSFLEEDADPGNRIPVEADFLFVYSTVPGYVSWRDTERGTWFIQVLCEVFNQYWNQLEIMQMLTLVNNQVANKPGQKKQMPSVDSRLTKSLYFKMFYTVNPSGSNIIRKQGGKPISF